MNKYFINSFILFLSFTISHYYKIKNIVFKSNELKVSGLFFGSIKIFGKDNLVQLKGKIRNSTITISGNNNNIYIGDGSISTLAISITGNNHNLSIQNHRGIVNSKIIMLDNSTSIYIGEMTGIGGARIVIAGVNNYIKIGKMNMISDNVDIWATDSHSIIDKDNGERINADQPIVIEDHVWIGSGVKILKGVHIANDAIVGMGSIVVNNIPSNSISAGVPNKIVRSDVNWLIERIEIISDMTIRR